MERRLTAILMADVVSYSRLMERHEVGTLAALQAHRNELIEPVIAARNGRIVKLMGDGALVEFASVVDAVESAVEIQNGLRARNANIAPDRRIDLRIGVHLGDVMVEGDDIYGDGVNVAARLESLAEAGGICLSQQALDQVETKLDLVFADMGEQQVKNIARPVRVHKVVMMDGSPPPPALSRGRPPPRTVLATGVVACLIFAGLAVFWWQPWQPTIERAVVERMAHPLPDRPSIAVLPFTNMSDDAAQEYFADGMTEDLITDLSKISGLFVIARNSSFSYKGQAVQVRQVAEELSVRYVLEGSVRRSGEQVRINAQLIDATTDGHIWAERYDGTLDDVFALQDNVTREIIAALSVNLTGEEMAQPTRHGTENAAAHDAYLQGWAHYKLRTAEELIKALPFFEEAIRLDPDYAQAHAALASAYWDVFKNDWAFDMGMASFQAEERANSHLEAALKSPTPLAHALQARIMASMGFHDFAVTEAEKAVVLDSNDATAHAGLADALVFADRPGDGLGAIEIAMRLDPHYPPSYLITLGAAQFGVEKFAEAAATFERAIKRNPDNEIPFIYLASSYGHLGRTAEADDAIIKANGLRNLSGSGELSLRETEYYGSDHCNCEIDLTQFGSKPIQDLVHAGLVNIPALKWQFLITRHPVLGPGGNSWVEVQGASQIDLPTAKSFFDRGVMFIDMSRDGIWNAGHIPGSVHLSTGTSAGESQLRFNENVLRKVARHDDEIVIYGLYIENSPLESPGWEAAKAIVWGYSKVYFFNGGARAWKKAGYPVETGE
jgi:adenylate cyclase